MAMALTWVDCLLEESRISFLIAKNAMQPDDHHRLGVVEMDDIYDSVIHFSMECVLSVYLAKEQRRPQEGVWGLRGGEKSSTRGLPMAKGSGRRD